MARILLLSRGCYVDSSSGAAIASRNMLEALASVGHRVACFCGTLLDHRRHCFDLTRLPSAEVATRSEDLSDFLTFANCCVGFASTLARDVAGVPVFFHLDASPDLPEPFSYGETSFVGDFGRVLGLVRPDLIFTYGSDDDIHRCVVRAKDAGVPTVLVLHNTSHSIQPVVQLADRIIAPSRFASNLYRHRLNINVSVLPNVLNESLCIPNFRTPGYVLFVNPSFEKGVSVFSRLVYEFGLRRPEIPFLAVESRGTEQHVAACGLDLRRGSNIFFMSQTERPADFWALAKLCIMPSLCEEAQGMVAIEAACNRVPIICSDRGALPETVGRGGRILGLPRYLTPASRVPPPLEDVADWSESILDLWDNQAAYDELAAHAGDESMRWAGDATIEAYIHLIEDTLASKDRSEGIGGIFTL